MIADEPNGLRGDIISTLRPLLGLGLTSSQRVFQGGKLALLAMISLSFGVFCQPAYSADTVSQDLNGLQGMTTWNVSQPDRQPSTPDQTCGITDLRAYEINRLDHEVGSDLDGSRATHQVKLLDARVTAYLKQHDWKRTNINSDHSAIPDLHRCYRKRATIIQIYQTTSRCTMNTPCTEYDGFAIVVYQPRTK